MLLNRLEYALMNNPIRASIQRRLEARRFLDLGGPVTGALALEVGCGRGVGIEIVFDRFHAAHVDAFDLDPRMVRQARRRTRHRGDRVALWTGSVTAIPVADGRYGAVFDFGILHHVPRWQDGVAEIARVLAPGGRLYAEEVFDRLLGRFPYRQLFRHPRQNRFDAAGFAAGLEAAGLEVIGSSSWRDDLGWFVARRT